MLRQHHKIFQGAQIFRDTLLVFLSLVVAYNIRFKFSWVNEWGISEQVAIPSKRETALIALSLIIIWPFVGWVQGLYTSRRTKKWYTDIWRVIKSAFISFALLVTCTYLFREVKYSRITLVLWLANVILLVGGVRFIFHSILRKLRRKGYNLRHVLIVGMGDLGLMVEKIILKRKEMGLKVIGFLDHRKNLDNKTLANNELISDNKILGHVNDFSQVVDQLKENKIQCDQVVIALPLENQKDLGPLMDTLSQHTFDVRFVPDIYQYITLCGSIENFGGLPMINLQGSPLTPLEFFLKRILDIIGACFALVIFSPIYGLISLGIKLTDSGPIFYKQKRVGYDNKPFDMYKFRSMKMDADKVNQWTTQHDSRVTKIGKVLRKYSLDELPQFYNVLMGNMSLVGPRPEQPLFIEEFKKSIPKYALRHKMKAGITGWAQIHGLRGDTDIDDRIQHDLHYLENWSLFLDIKILLKTLAGGFLSKNAY